MIKSNPFIYRPYIDGLRALAVLPVVFFHAGFSWFKGGFVGVDIFFVISGFLITSIILKEKKNKNFSLKKFYLRRIRRIIPALFFVTLISIPFAIYLMSSNDLKIFSQSLFSVIFFISNFFFWKNGGYFGLESELQPLLHTWSLGVEEQFYIFFPIFLILIWRIKKDYLIPIIIFGSLISLLSAQIGGNFKYLNLLLNFPYFKLPFDWNWQASIANFYLPFGRIWELMIGVLVAFYLQKKEIKERKINNIYSLIGLSLIIFSIIFFSENLQYPSIFTLLPTIGTALVIIFTSQNTYLNKILSNKILVSLGLISFSFYLWHQPILAISRIYIVSNLNLTLSILLIIFSLILSFFSWRFIEKPFRDEKIISNNKLITYFFSFFLIIFLIASLLYFKKIGFSQINLPNNLIESFQGSKKDGCFDIKFAHSNYTDKWFCEIGKKDKETSFVAIGDSHLLSFKSVLEKAAMETDSKGIFTGYAGCIPLLEVYSVRSDQNEYNCKSLNEKVFNYIKIQKIKKIFLIARWTYYTDGNYDLSEFSHISKDDNYSSNKNNSRKTFSYGLMNTIKKYNNIGVSVIFVHQAPLQVFTPNYIYLNSFKKNKLDFNKFLYNLSVNYEKHISFQEFVRNETSFFNTESMFKEINPDSYFCDKKKCLIGTQNGSFYSDDDHLSLLGSMKLKDEIKKFLD